MKAVIGHFSSRWDTFIKGMETDFAKFGKTLDDPNDGLVVRMQKAEKSLQEIQQGKNGNKGLDETLTDMQGRIVSLEANQTSKANTPTATLADPNTVKDITDRLTALEKENANLKLILNEVAELDEENKVQLKHFDLIQMKADIGQLKYFQETATGFMEVTLKRVDSMDSRVTVNMAHTMQNNLIFGGIRVSDEESVLDAVKRFISTIMNITPKNYDIYDAEQLGKGYSRIVKGREMNFPPTVKVKCSEYFASKIMSNARVLSGKTDEVEGFKYYVKRSKPEAQRALYDKYAEDVKGYRQQNASATTEADKVKYYFTPTHLIVDDEPVEDKVNPPTFTDMINIDFPTLHEMDRMEYYSSMPKVIRRSTFQAYGFHIASIDEISLAYKKIRYMHKNADHVVAAYRLRAGKDLLQGCAHDRAYYGDQEIIQTLRKAKAINVVVFVARLYGGIHLGGAHFDAISEITNEVLRMMTLETIEPEVVEQPTSTPTAPTSTDNRPARPPKGTDSRQSTTHHTQQSQQHSGQYRQRQRSSQTWSQQSQRKSYSAAAAGRGRGRVYNDRYYRNNYDREHVPSQRSGYHRSGPSYTPRYNSRYDRRDNFQRFDSHRRSHYRDYSDSDRSSVD